ncbi:MAG: DUF6923 family protein [Lewinella sp.]|uniref:DUF6923 family protein n=1 Tax=Lewinella sp. TaxID=2004506 RepID=UPI003D6B4A6E
MKTLFFSCILLVSMLFFLPSLIGQPHQCTNQFFISLYQSNNPSFTRFYEVEATEDQVNFNTVFNANAWINAIGFNRLDHYIYGVRRNTGDIIRIAANGQVTTVGTEPVVVSEGGWITGAGDVASDGRFVVNQRPRNSLFIYQVTPSFNFLEELPLRWDPSTGNSGPVTIALDDIVFDPCNANVAFTFQRFYDVVSAPPEPVATKNNLLRIDMDADSPTYGNVFTVGAADPNVVQHIGAMFFNNQGELYGYGATNVNPSTSPNQNRMVLIDAQTGAATLVGTGPSAVGNDGCSCPYTLSIVKELEGVNYGCESTSVTYSVTIINKAYENLSGLRLRDQFPAGTVIAQIVPPNPMGVAATAGTGIGEELLIYDNFSIADGDTLRFEITVSTDVQGDFSSQAIIESLPALLGDQILSDDPTTVAINDPTRATLNNPTNGEVLVENEAFLCEGDSLFFGGETINTAGEFEYLVETLDPALCDTLFRLTVSIREEVELLLEAFLCPGESYAWQDTLLGAGSYQFLSPSVTSGCDTVTYLELYALPPAIGTAAITLCGEESVLVDGVSYQQPGEYEVLLQGASSEGCDSLLLLEVFPPQKLYIPNAFSPLNRDGVNDEVVLFPGKSGARIDRFDIFSRWGEHLYRLDDVDFNGPLSTWDGTFRGRPAQTGVYVYYLNYTCSSGKQVFLEGDLHLVN